MAAEYQVNIKLNTQQFKAELSKLDKVVKDAGTINLAPTKQQTSALKLQSKEIKDQAKQAKTLLQLESQRITIDRQRQRLWHATDRLEQKGKNRRTKEIRDTIRERANALEQKNLLLVKEKGYEAEKLIKNAQHSLRLEKLKTAEIRKQQNQGLALRRLGDRAGRISRRAGPQLALPSSQLIQEQRSAEFTARANERTARAYARSAERGKEVLAASQASAKAAEQHYRWVEKRGAVGAPSSPLNVVGGRVRPGRQGWLSRMQQQNPGRFQLGAAGQGAMISGAFPLLFGQGPGVAGAGALGGGLGGFLGGQGGAFAGGLVATAVASGTADTVASTRKFAESLTSLDSAYNTAVQASLFSSKEAEKRAAVLKQLGETEKLSKLLTEEYIGVLGKDGLAAMQELGKQSDILSREWGTLTTRMGAFVAGPMAALLKAINVVLGGVNDESRFNNLQGALSGSSRSRFDAIYEEERNRGARRRHRRGGGTYMQRVVSDSRAQELTIGRAREEGLFNDLQGTFGGSDTGFNADIRSMELKIKYAKETLLLSDKQLKIESKIRELKGKDNSFDEAKYRQLATQLNQLEEQRKLYQQIGQTIKQGIVTAIESAITGAQSLGEVLRSITQTVGRAFLNAAINAGVGALTSSWGNTGNNANMHQGGSRAAVKRASGGYIDSPEFSLVGEGGEAEYIIPESKMNDAMARYAGGARGDDVLAGGGGDVGEGGIGGASSGVIDVTFNSHVINDVSYVTYSDFQAGVQQAAAEGAKRGEQATLRRLQTSPSTRRRVGV